MPIQDLLAGILGGGGLGTGGGGQSPTGPPSPPPMGPPGMDMGMQPGGQPEIPTDDSSSMAQQIKSFGTQISLIGAQLMSRGLQDAAISCARAVKELEKVPDLVIKHQQANPAPNMGMGGMGMVPPSAPSMGPPPIPGMS